MSAQVQLAVTLTEINCGKCGGVYALNERYRRQREENGGSWTCPYCRCGWGYTESIVSKLTKQLEAERVRVQNALSRANEAERDASAQRGQVTKVRNQLKRVAAGVCPCCNRTFQQLAKHMANKHPEVTT
jgi:DNA repair exonuclease SbcCD ATPase subunit